MFTPRYDIKPMNVIFDYPDMINRKEDIKSLKVENLSDIKKLYGELTKTKLVINHELYSDNDIELIHKSVTNIDYSLYDFKNNTDLVLLFNRIMIEFMNNKVSVKDADELYKLLII